MLSFGQKIKKQKTGEKTFYKNIRVVVCKKSVGKTKYSRNENILKINHLAKAIAHAKAKWLKKNAKNVRKTIL